MWLTTSLLLALTTAAPEAPRLTRVLIFDVEHEPADEALAGVVEEALAAEVRKLRGASVLTQRDVGAMLELEAERQVMGCDDDKSCLAEIADALGVDALIIGSLATVGEQSVFALKRITPADAKVIARVQERLMPADGAEYLAAIGPSVEKLFVDLPLRSGQTRGVSDEIARRLNPPPLPPLAFIGTSGASVIALGVAGVFGALNIAAAGNYDEIIKEGQGTGTTLARRDSARQALDDTALGAWVSLGAGAALAAAALVVLPLTNFEETSE